MGTLVMFVLMSKVCTFFLDNLRAVLVTKKIKGGIGRGGGPIVA